jgi:ribosomal protein L17
MRTNIISKAEKLIALANSGTPNERRTAMRKLQDLLNANSMTVDDLAPTEDAPAMNAFEYLSREIKRRFQWKE